VFDFAVFGQDHGTKKPDPALFRVALERAGFPADQLLHVGDSLPNDVGGAQSADVRSVWLNRPGRANDTPHRPDHEIRSLFELLPLCGR
jgi:putative hydrolase of the HAD superfamily